MVGIVRSVDCLFWNFSISKKVWISRSLISKQKLFSYLTKQCLTKRRETKKISCNVWQLELKLSFLGIAWDMWGIYSPQIAPEMHWPSSPLVFAVCLDWSVRDRTQTHVGSQMSVRLHTGIQFGLTLSLIYYKIKHFVSNFLDNLKAIFIRIDSEVRFKINFDEISAQWHKINAY